jgi:hypothetical protein
LFAATQNDEDRIASDITQEAKRYRHQVDLTQRMPLACQGYLYRSLKVQGPDAPGGAMNYLADGQLQNGLGALVFFCQLHLPAKEIDATQHRLATLPSHLHLRSGRRLHQLPNVAVQYLICHEPTFLGRVQILLRQEETVLTAEVTGRTGRFGQ